MTELGKIRRSPDWSIKHTSDVNAKIRKGESLEEYCEEDYPLFDSITNWVFEELLKTYCIDPNSLVCVLPINFDKAVTDFYKPVAELIESDRILEFLDTEYVIYKSTEVGSYVDSNGDYKFDASVFYYLDRDVIIRIQQNGNTDNLQYTEYPNITKSLPVFKIPGIFYKKKGKNKINKSRLSPLVPFLNEATREYSDLQAEVVQHIHSTMWYYSNSPCKKCNGTGQIINKLPGKLPGAPMECTDCRGAGFMQSSPYKQNIRISPPSNVNSHPVPTPPAGFIQKQTDIVKLQSERVKEHLYDALATINFEYLMQAPLSQSGVAKAYDRDSANNFVHGIAEDLVRVMDRVYGLVNQWRYNQLVAEEDLEGQLPVITVPEKYDLFNSQIILAQIDQAKRFGVNTMVLNEMLREFTAKYFVGNPDVSKMLDAVIELDPLESYTVDEKIQMVSAGLVKQEDAIISSYIHMFIQLAMTDDPTFIDKSAIDKRAILQKMADDKIKEMKSSGSLIKAQPAAAPGAPTPPPQVPTPPVK